MLHRNALGKIVRESLRKFLERQIQEIVMDSRRFTSSRLMTTHETLLLKNKSTKKVYMRHIAAMCVQLWCMSGGFGFNWSLGKEVATRIVGERSLK